MMTNIRQAQPEDAGQIEKYIHSSGREIYDFTYQRYGRTALDYIGFEFASGRGGCGFNNVTVIESEGAILGTVCFYTGTESNFIIQESLKNTFKFFGFFRGLKALFSMRHLSTMITKPTEQELYIFNLGISEKCRGQGLGRKLIEYVISKAREDGLEKVSLDVATNNPRAEKLYTQLDFKVVQTKHPPKAINHLPGSKKMEIVF